MTARNFFKDLNDNIDQVLKSLSTKTSEVHSAKQMLINRVLKGPAVSLAKTPSLHCTALNSHV